MAILDKAVNPVATKPLQANPFGTPVAYSGTQGTDFGVNTDPGDFWRNITLGNTGSDYYSNETKNYLAMGGSKGWNPEAAMAGYRATQGGPDNPIGFAAWLRGDKTYTDMFGAPPPPGTTFEQFRQGIGLGGKAVGTPTLYTPPPGAPGSAGNPVGGGGVPTPTSPGGAQPVADPSADPYALDIDKYLDPGMAFRLKQGQDSIGNVSAAQGNFLSGSTLKDLMTFGQDQASQEYANAAARAAQQQGFKYGVDTGDRDFAYKASTGDRDYNTNLALAMSKLGLDATGGASSANNSLATAIATLLSGKGDIQAGGTIGGSNAITGSASDIVKALQGGMTWQQIMAKFGGGTT